MFTQDPQHAADTMGIHRSEMNSQRSGEYWQFASEEQPHPRRLCTIATLEYNNIFHNNGKYFFNMTRVEHNLEYNIIFQNNGKYCFDVGKAV